MGDRKEEVPLQILAICNHDAPKVSSKYAWTLGACWILLLALIWLGFSDRQYELDAQPTTRIRNYDRCCMVLIAAGLDTIKKQPREALELKA